MSRSSHPLSLAMRGLREALSCSGSQPMSGGANAGHQDGPWDLDPIYTISNVCEACHVVPHQRYQRPLLRAPSPGPQGTAPSTHWPASPPQRWELQLRIPGERLHPAAAASAKPYLVLFSPLFTPVKNCRTTRQAFPLDALLESLMRSVSIWSLMNAMRALKLPGTLPKKIYFVPLLF